MQLEIRNVSKRYRNGVQALKNVSLTIPPGMYGLLGPNGAGKSTLMRTIATLQQPDTGEIKLGDLDVLKQKDEVRKTLGYLPQEFGVYPNVTAQELLDHFAILEGITDKRARKGAVDALLGNPKLVIVDEPTAGLDPAERVRFLNLLGDLGENSIVMLSTHIVEDVSELYRRMAIIDNGEIVLEAEPLRAIEELRGRIWRRMVPKSELPNVAREHSVIATKLLAGRTFVHVHSETPPGPEYDPVEPDLKDVYFTAMAGHNGLRRAQVDAGEAA